MLDDLRSDRDKALDASQTKRDDFNHARESHAGLRQLAHATLNPLRSSDAEKRALKALKDPYRRVRRVNGAYPKGSSYVAERLDEALVWLSCHRSELPTEIEREDGLINVGDREKADSRLNDTERKQFNEGADSPFVDAWAMDVFGWGGYDSLHKVADGLSTTAELDHHAGADYNPRYIPETDVIDTFLRPRTDTVERTPTEILPYYGIDGVRLEALRIRGERLKAAHARRDARMRWYGMEEYDAVAKAQEKLDAGTTRTKAKSNAKLLPPIARLHELFHVRGSDLINRRLDRVVSGAKVKIDGELYATHRVAYAVATGSDPADKVVRDGKASEYRKAEGRVFERPDGRWEARVYLEGDWVTIGTYAGRDVLPTDPMADHVEECIHRVTGKRVAEEAIDLYLKTLEDQ